MQDMIKRIVDMDQTARDITTEAQMARIQAEKEIKARRKLIREDLLNQARSRMKVNEATERTLAEEAWKETEACHAQIAEKLAADYQQNGDRWVAEILNRVLG